MRRKIGSSYIRFLINRQQNIFQADTAKLVRFITDAEGENKVPDIYLMERGNSAMSAIEKRLAAAIGKWKSDKSRNR